MPLYDYRCRACAHEFEALVRAGDQDPACRSCNSRDVERLLSTFAVSSAERTRAAATSARKKAAASAARDNIAMERESELHRREDH